MRFIAGFVLFCGLACADIVSDVRANNARSDFASSQRLLEIYRTSNGITPEYILAMSWAGRGAQAAKNWDFAERFAAETRKLCLEALKSRKLDDEPMLPLALGASIEVQGLTLAGRGERDQAVSFLKQELKTWHGTSIRTRIAKNLNLLNLEGKPAPALEMAHYLGPKPVSLEKLKGKPVILFFWAHWCVDCKAQAPVLQQIQKEFASDGLVIVGPTQHYGYIAVGQDAPPEQETPYIDRIRTQYYSMLSGMTVPVSEENFRNFGSSSSPTLVVIDRKGVVRSFHPGKMSLEELRTVLKQIVAN